MWDQDIGVSISLPLYISEALSYFIKYMNLIENQLDMKIKILTTD